MYVEFQFVNGIGSTYFFSSQTAFPLLLFVFSFVMHMCVFRYISCLYLSPHPPLDPNRLYHLQFISPNMCVFNILTWCAPFTMTQLPVLPSVHFTCYIFCVTGKIDFCRGATLPVWSLIYIMPRFSFNCIDFVFLFSHG